MVRCITFIDQLFFRVIVREYKCVGEGLLEVLERTFLRIFLSELSVLFRQLRQWHDLAQVFFDESAIEVGESKKGLDILNILWSFPFKYALRFRRVSFYAVGGHNVSQEHCFRGVEGCLGDVGRPGIELS